MPHFLKHWECSETNANFKFATTTKKLKMRLNRRRIGMIEGSEKNARRLLNFKVCVFVKRAVRKEDSV